MNTISDSTGNSHERRPPKRRSITLQVYTITNDQNRCRHSSVSLASYLLAGWLAGCGVSSHCKRGSSIKRPRWFVRVVVVAIRCTKIQSHPCEYMASRNRFVRIRFISLFKRCVWAVATVSTISSCGLAIRMRDIHSYSRQKDFEWVVWSDGKTQHDRREVWYWPDSQPLGTWCNDFFSSRL